MFENVGHSVFSPIDLTEAREQVYWNPLEGADVTVKLYYPLPYQENEPSAQRTSQRKKTYAFILHFTLSSFHYLTKNKKKNLGKWGKLHVYH